MGARRASGGGLGQSGQERRQPANRLGRLLEDYDYWDWYVDWYVTQVSFAAIALGVAAVTLFGVALGVRSGHPILASLLAAGSGAAMSVASRLPPMGLYGELATLYLKMTIRLFSGILASAAGFWLVAVPFATPSPSQSGCVTVGWDGADADCEWIYSEYVQASSSGDGHTWVVSIQCGNGGICAGTACHGRPGLSRVSRVPSLDTHLPTSTRGSRLIGRVPCAAAPPIGPARAASSTRPAQPLPRLRTPRSLMGPP